MAAECQPLQEQLRGVRALYRTHLLECLDHTALNEVAVPLLDAPVDLAIQPACSSHRQTAIMSCKHSYTCMCKTACLQTKWTEVHSAQCMLRAETALLALKAAPAAPWAVHSWGQS